MTKTYTFVSDYAVITFTVPGEADWTEEMWDTVAETDLKSYVTTPEDYYMEDCSDDEELLSV